MKEPKGTVAQLSCGASKYSDEPVQSLLDLSRPIVSLALTRTSPQPDIPSRHPAGLADVEIAHQQLAYGDAAYLEAVPRKMIDV